MIRVTVECVPLGDETAKYRVGRLEIINTGQHRRRPEYGQYVVWHNGKLVGRIPTYRRVRGYLPLVAKAWQMAERACSGKRRVR